MCHPVAAAYTERLRQAAELYNRFRFHEVVPVLQELKRHYLLDRPTQASHDSTYYSIVSCLGVALNQIGEHHAAVGELCALNVDLAAALPEPHPTSVKVCLALADTYERAGEPLKRIEVVQRVVDVLSEHLAARRKQQHCNGDTEECTGGVTDIDATVVLLLSARETLANAYGSVGDAARQLQLLREVLQSWRAHQQQVKDRSNRGSVEPTPATGHAEVLRVLGNLANAHGALGHRDEQLRLLQHVVDAKRELFGPRHLELARPLHNLGVAYGAHGNHVQQLHALLDCLDIKSQHFDESNVELVVTLRCAASAFASLGKSQAALSFLLRAQTILESQPHAATLHRHDLVQIKAEVDVILAHGLPTMVSG